MTIKCCICGREIDESQSNNALPVMDGRCCQECNDSIVLSARLAQMFGGK